MTNYESLRDLSQLLKVKFVFQKHWIDWFGWGMAEVMHKVLLEAINVTFIAASFIMVNVDEVTAINNTQWLLIHLHMVEQWRRIPILLCVETICMSTISKNMFAFMLKCLFEFGGLGLEELCEKLVSIGCNGSSMFQGHKMRVTHQFKEKVAHFVIGVHYFVHKTNLAIIILSNVHFVHWLEHFLQSLYAFFTHSLNFFVEF